ncbi:MAG TPA: phage capsid protein, partial [Prosthecobacter sp.]
SPYVQRESFTGESERFQRIGAQEFEKRTGRREKTKVKEAPLSFRHITNEDYTLANVLDKIDKRKMGAAGTGLPQAYVESHAAGYNRLCDRVILSSVLGPAYDGEKATSASVVNLGNSNLIADNYKLGAAGGLTYAKMVHALVMLQQNSHLSPDAAKVVLACTPLDLESVYDSVDPEESSLRSRILDVIEGRSDKLGGFQIVKTTIYDATMPGSSATNRRLAAWMYGGARFNEGTRESRMDELDTQNYDLQVYSSGYVGGTRMEEALVVGIDCKIA